MAFVIKTAKTLRNHWKKSTFGAVAVVYIYGRVKEYSQIQELMRVYCKKALKYGKEPLSVDAEPRNITVVLNATANKKNAEDDFQKYCAPILHLAGISLTVIKTESEGHARNLIDKLENTEAVIVAGGDGTLSEVITGLLRRTQENSSGIIPIGILPLGKTNSIATRLFSTGDKLAKVRAMAEASMAVVESSVKPIDVLRIERTEGESKPIYAVAGIKWGAYRDAELKKDSYWLFGGYRKYAAYLFNGYKNSLTWKCDASISYSPPCAGCTNCTKLPEQPMTWSRRFLRPQPTSQSSRVNPECEIARNKDISTVDFTLEVPPDADTPKLRLRIGPQSVGYLDFVKNGWRSEDGGARVTEEVIDLRTVEIKPKDEGEGREAWFSIDNEKYEVKPIRVTLLPRFINVFCKKERI